MTEQRDDSSNRVDKVFVVPGTKVLVMPDQSPETVLQNFDKLDLLMIY